MLAEGLEDAVDARRGPRLEAQSPSAAAVAEVAEIGVHHEAIVEEGPAADGIEVGLVAEAAGSLGDLIPVLNLDTKRRVRARVDGKGRVSVKSTL